MQRSKGSNSGSVWPVNAHLSALDSLSQRCQTSTFVGITGWHREELECLSLPDREEGGNKEGGGERKDEKVLLRSTERAIFRERCEGEKETVKCVIICGEGGGWDGKESGCISLIHEIQH